MAFGLKIIISQFLEEYGRIITLEATFSPILVSALKISALRPILGFLCSGFFFFYSFSPFLF
jgi:hypothetical protein